MKTTNNTEKTYRMNFTEAELQILYYALNDFSLEMMDKSLTWGKGLGWEDGFHKEARETAILQQKVYERMNK